MTLNMMLDNAAPEAIAGALTQQHPGLFFLLSLKITPLTDKNITSVLQAPYTERLFSLWLGISIAVR